MYFLNNREFIFCRCAGCGFPIHAAADARQYNDKYFCPGCYELEKKKTISATKPFSGVMMKKVKDFRTDCKIECKRDCFAGGCPHAGAGDCARFEKLLDFNFKTTSTGSKDQ